MSLKLSKMLFLLSGITTIAMISQPLGAWSGIRYSGDGSYNTAPYTTTQNNHSFNRVGSHNSRDVRNSNLGKMYQITQFENTNIVNSPNSVVNQIANPVINFGDTTQNIVGQGQ